MYKNKKEGENSPDHKNKLSNFFPHTVFEMKNKKLEIVEEILVRQRLNFIWKIDTHATKIETLSLIIQTQNNIEL